MNATLIERPVSRFKQPTTATVTEREAWASAPKQPMRLEVVELGALGAEEVDSRDQ